VRLTEPAVPMCSKRCYASNDGGTSRLVQVVVASVNPARARLHPSPMSCGVQSKSSKVVNSELPRTSRIPMNGASIVVRHLVKSPRRSESLQVGFAQAKPVLQHSEVSSPRRRDLPRTWPGVESSGQVTAAVRAVQYQDGQSQRMRHEHGVAGRATGPQCFVPEQRRAPHAAG